MAEEEELRESGTVDRVREPSSSRGECPRFPEAKLVRPVLPTAAAVCSLDRHKLGVVVKPGLLGPESLEFLGDHRIAAATSESGVRRSKDALFPRNHRSVVDVVAWEVRHIRWFDEAVVDEETRGDEVGVSGEG